MSSYYVLLAAKCFLCIILFNLKTMLSGGTIISFICSQRVWVICPRPHTALVVLRFIFCLLPLSLWPYPVLTSNVQVGGTCQEPSLLRTMPAPLGGPETSCYETGHLYPVAMVLITPHHWHTHQWNLQYASADAAKFPPCTWVKCQRNWKQL